MKKYIGLLLLFTIITIVAIIFKDQFKGWEIDYRVILGANTLLFLLGVLSLMLHVKAITNANPQVFIRSLMTANLLKLLVLAGAAFIYIAAMGKNANANAVFAALFLYIVYTFVEKRATLQISKSKNR